MADTEATQEVEAPQEPTVQATTTPVEEVRDPQAVLAKNRELIGIQKELKEKLRLFEADKKAAEEAKLQEEGKYKELLEAKEKELAELQSATEERDSYRAYFEAKLEKAKEGLTDLQIKAVDGFNGSLSDKVAMAEEFKGTTERPTSSPGASRPGSTSPNQEFDVKDYMGKEGILKLNKLYHDNKELYDAVIDAKRRIK